MTRKENAKQTLARWSAALLRLPFFTRTDGVSTIEFALIVPVLLLILASVVDLGGALKTKFELNSAVTAAANFALINAASVNSTGGEKLATDIAAIIKGGISGNGDVDVQVNNGAAVSFVAGETTTGATSGKADKCYCPSRVGNAISFGSAVACGNACPTGGTAGKFVTVRAAKPYNPLFGGFGVVERGTITVEAVVQPQ